MKKFCCVIILCLFFSQCLSNTGIIKDTAGQGADGSVKKLKYTDKLQSGEEKYPYDLLMMRTSNNDIVFISTEDYLDIRNMSINTIEIPTKFSEDVVESLPEYETFYGYDQIRFFSARPPYSNNKIHIRIRGGSDFFLYDITNNFLDVTNYINHYDFGHPDSSDYYKIYSSEYWLGSSESGTLWLMQKDGAFHKNPLEYIISDFSGTVFDNDYIMETIRSINETGQNIITKDDVYFYDNRGRDYKDSTIPDIYEFNAFFIFINRMGAYFNINIQDIFQFGDIVYGKTPRREVGIYRDGFFIQNGEKVLLLDIGNRKTALYTFDEYNDYINNQNHFSSDCRLFITNDSKTLLLRIKYAERIGYSTDEYTVIYKYEL